MAIEVRSCHICSESRYEARYEFQESRIVRCENCGFMWLDPKPSEDEVSQVYNHNYFKNELFFDNSQTTLFGYADYTLERLNRQREFDNLVRRGLHYLNSAAPKSSRPAGESESKSMWLDIGCGLGYLLDCAYDYGFDVVGVEFNSHAIESITRRYRYRVEHASVLNSGFDEERFDVISMTDVIEHLHDPRATVQRMFDLTKPGGVAIVTTMDSDSLSSRILGKRLEDFRRTREHLYFFNRSTATRLLEDAGYQVISIKSYGHTFELGFLSDRIGLISKRLGKLAKYLVQRLDLNQVRVHINPGTKMVIFARREYS